jgi:hypothetical protein
MRQIHSSSHLRCGTALWSFALIALLSGASLLAAQTAETFQSKIAPGLQELAQKGKPLYVFIELQNNPHSVILRRVEQRSSFRLLSAEARMAEIATSPARTQLDWEFAEARQDAEDARVELRNQAYAEIHAVIQPEQDRLEARLIGLGATRIQRYTILNMLAAEVPPFALSVLAREPDVARISEVGVFAGDAAQPKFSVDYVGAPLLWKDTPTNFTGKTGPALAILDSGINLAHPAFDKKKAANIVSMSFLDPNDINDPCWDDHLDVRDYAGHGTAVADVAAGGGDYEGVARDLGLQAPGTIYNLKVAFKPKNTPACSNFPTKILEADIWKALDYLILNSKNSDLVVNYSASYIGPQSDEYDRRFDRVVDNNSPHVTIVATAGNIWDGRGLLRDTPIVAPAGSVRSPGNAYNVISAAAQKAARLPGYTAQAKPNGNDTRTPIDEITTFSGRGPAPGGRNKPDIAAPGVQIFAANSAFSTSANKAHCIPGGAVDSDCEYLYFSGTSLAAPHVAGAAVLVAEAIRTGNNMALKALLLNQARRPGASGWAADRGWGFLYLKDFPGLLKGVAAGKQPCESNGAAGGGYQTFCFLDSVTDQQGGQRRYYEGTAQGFTTATLAWNRHFPDNAENAQPLPLNKLELGIYQKNGDKFVRQGAIQDSTKGNVEQVEVNSSADVLVEVALNGALQKPTGQPNFAESFALATSTGFTPKKAPSLELSCATPVIVNPGSPFTAPCTLTNHGELTVADTTAECGQGCTATLDNSVVGPGASVTVTVKGTVPAQGSTLGVTVTGYLADDPFQGTGSLRFGVSSCVPTTLNPPGGSASKDGGPGSFLVFAPAGCSFFVLAEAGYVHVTSPATAIGTGAGITVNYNMDANNTGKQRLGNIAIGQTGAASNRHLAEFQIVQGN